MTYNIISTGSQGNAVIINDEILIDCGVPWKTLKPYAKPLKLVLLTHEHGDHFKPSTVRALHNERPALRWGCCEWMVGPLLEAGVTKNVIVPCTKRNERILLGGWFQAEPVQLIHNIPNCGYKMLFLRAGELVFYATDCATLDGIEAKSYDLYMIEANHARAELEARIEAKRAAGEYAYEVEAARNHLSREQAESWLAENAGPNSKYVFLHQHREGG